MNDAAAVSDNRSIMHSAVLLNALGYTAAMRLTALWPSISRFNISYTSTNHARRDQNLHMFENSTVSFLSFLLTDLTSIRIVSPFDNIIFIVPI